MTGYLEINRAVGKKPKLRKNNDYGFTLQKIICDIYKIPINNTANKHFNANYNESYEDDLIPLIPKIFADVESEPIELLTFTSKYTDSKQRVSPHNFLLKDGKTLSIRSMKTNDKVAPRVVGQAGYKALNDHFSDIYGKIIENHNDIKELMFTKIDEILPIFINYLFQSDYTIFISHKSHNSYNIFKSNEIEYDSFSRSDFTFTEDPVNWNNSTTLKYHNKPIAVIQTPKGRAIIFRFIVPALDEFLSEVKHTNETLGISTEAAICEIFKLEKPDSFVKRESKNYIKILKPVLTEAFKNMPPAIDHSGSTKGERGGTSKCSYDFVLDGDLTLSVKSNKGKMVCPPEVGQPGAETCFSYFSKFLPEGTTEITKTNFKEMVYEHINELIPIYVDHLFDSDWLLWVYEVKGGYEHKEINRADIIEYTKDPAWKKENFTFTQQSIEDWKESNTLKYDGITLGNFQVHNNRNSFKFRFNMKNLLELILE